MNLLAMTLTGLAKEAEVKQQTREVEKSGGTMQPQAHSESSSEQQLKRAAR